MASGRSPRPEPDIIDAVGRTRGRLGAVATHDGREQTLHQLLAELDGFDARTTVILMATTNRPVGDVCPRHAESTIVSLRAARRARSFDP